MKQQKQSGFTHLMIFAAIVAVGVVGLLGFVFWQNFMQPKTIGTKTNTLNPSSSKKTETPKTVAFTEDLDKFTTKTLIGSDSEYDVYILDNKSNRSNKANQSSGTVLQGNIVVYSKSTNKAVEINRSISIPEAGINVSGMEQQNGVYLVIDSGTSPDRTKTVISLVDGDIVDVNLVVNDMNYWDNHYIYTVDDPTYNNRPYGSGMSLSIYSLDLSTKTSTKIIASTPDKDYIVNSVTGNILNYSESSATNPNNSVKLTLDLNTLK